jgi:Ca-activated chloride channel family protein
MQFAQPGWLWLLMLVPMPWLFSRRRARIQWPSLEGLPPRRRIGLAWLQWLPSGLRGLAVACLAVALARPQTVGGITRIAAKGVAIVIALDDSSSMNTVDFPVDRGIRKISRLEASRATVAQFVEGRPDDLIGLVVFANYPELACPPSLDHPFVLDAVRAVRAARPGDDGTNIGDAMAYGIDALLRASPLKKLLVLLTDGNNEPAVPKPLDPEQAAILARDFGVTVHTIAIGRLDGLPGQTAPDEPVAARADGSGPNFALLERLAELTGGRSFAATDSEGLTDVFKTIDALEKSPVRGQILTRYNDHYRVITLAALVILIAERILAFGRLRRLP